MKKILVLGCIFIACQNVFAQKILYLKPAIGAQWTLCSVDKSQGNNEVFGASKGSFNPNVSLLMELSLNEKWAVAAGWSSGSIGWGYSLEMPNELTKNPAKIGSFGQASTAVAIHRFPVLVKYNFANLNWRSSAAENKEKKFSMKFYAQTGLSLDYLPKTRFGESTNAFLGSGVADSYGDSIVYYENTTALNKLNASVIAGLGTQIYFREKPRLDITVFYSQGLRNMIREDVAYQLNSYKNTGLIFSRGSIIGATLAYPIQLKTFERKRV